MKITEISTQEYRWPRKVPITNGKHTYTHVDFALVVIRTDAGITGIGLGNGGEIWRAVINRLSRELIGEDPVNVERLWHKMWIPKLLGRRGLTTRAISSIDIGLWDIRAKLANLPLYKLLGGFFETASRRTSPAATTKRARVFGSSPRRWKTTCAWAQER